MAGTPNRTNVGSYPLLFLADVFVAASLACSQLAGKTETPYAERPEKWTMATAATGGEATDHAAGGAATEQVAPASALSKSFPVPPDAQIDPETVSENEPGRGSFTVRAGVPVSELVDFYSAELAVQGWSERYTDANVYGGVTQFWKKSNLYLSMEYGYDDSGALVKIKYQTIAADALSGLPPDFPFPDKAELTNTSDGMWDFYIEREFSEVVAFYEKASAAWAPCAGSVAEGEGDDGGGQKFPAGVTPMPSPTRDARTPKDLCWVLPSQNQVELYIRPHGNATLLHVYVTSLNPSDSGLPADVPIYPGATIQSAEPGMVTFQAGASLEKVKTFYQEKLAAAGWTLDGQPIESEGAVMMNWKKGNQTVMILITALGANDCLVMIAYEES